MSGAEFNGMVVGVMFLLVYYIGKTRGRRSVTPIDMLLFCPQCDAQHIDKPSELSAWQNPPHRSHLCQQCGWIWRVADVATNGVAMTRTNGSNDRNPYPMRRLVRGTVPICARCFSPDHHVSDCPVNGS